MLWYSMICSEEYVMLGTRSPAWAALFWMGDQLVTFDAEVDCYANHKVAQAVGAGWDAVCNVGNA